MIFFNIIQPVSNPRKSLKVFTVSATSHLQYGRIILIVLAATSAVFIFCFTFFFFTFSSRNGFLYTLQRFFLQDEEKSARGRVRSQR